MAKLIHGNAIAEDAWQLVQLPKKDEPVKKQAGKAVLFRLTGDVAATPEDIAAVDIPAGKVILPLTVWLARKDTLAARLAQGEIGVWLDSFEEPATLVDSLADLNALPLIALNFPKFIDGRGYSVARLVRERYGFRNELRAIGEVLRDQLFYMKRCGFDSFALAEGRDIEAALAGLRDFSDPYQGAFDEPRPLFRRAARSPA